MLESRWLGAPDECHIAGLRIGLQGPHLIIDIWPLSYATGNWRACLTIIGSQANLGEMGAMVAHAQWVDH